MIMAVFILGFFFAFFLIDGVLYLFLRSTLFYMPFVATAYHFVEFSENLRQRRKNG